MRPIARRPFILAAALGVWGAQSGVARPGAAWRRGPWADPGYFPIGVWLQNPEHATRYQALGVNLYLALWKGPTAQQLAQLKAVGMQAIVAQNEVGLADRSGTIIGWIHDDEPDNAQPNGTGGFGEPVAPAEIVRRYEEMKAADPARPVLINFGRGAAWDEWYGRKSRTNRPDDYRHYLKGADIASFDIYPFASRDTAIRGQLWRVGYGVSRLRQWATPGTPVWAVIETGNITGEGAATPAQVTAMTWSAIVKGATGLVYFVHQFKPVFNSARLLDDEPMKTAIAATNARIRELAPALNAPRSEQTATARAQRPDSRIDTMRTDSQGETYFFVVNLLARSESVDFALSGVEDARADLIGEERTISIRSGRWSDNLEPYGVRIFRIQKLAPGDAPPKR